MPPGRLAGFGSPIHHPAHRDAPASLLDAQKGPGPSDRGLFSPNRYRAVMRASCRRPILARAPATGQAGWAKEAGRRGMATWIATPERGRIDRAIGGEGEVENGKDKTAHGLGCTPCPGRRVAGAGAPRR